MLIFIIVQRYFAQEISMAIVTRGSGGQIKFSGTGGRLYIPVPMGGGGGGGPIVSSGLILHLDAGNPTSYPGSGNTWYDLSGNGKNATLYNTPTYSPSDGGTLYFNSALSQYAQGPGLGSRSNWTITIWAYALQFQGGDRAFFTDVYGNWLNFAIREGSTGPYGAFVGANGLWSPTSEYAASTNTWYNITATWDGTNLKLYINGTLQQTATPGTTSLGDNLGYRIARRWDNPDYSDVKIPVAMAYDRALTSGEIVQNFDALKSRYGF